MDDLLKKTFGMPKGGIPGIEGVIVEESTIDKYQGREFTATLQANTEEELDAMLDSLHRFAEENDIEKVSVLHKGRDVDGGWEATIKGHNINIMGAVKKLGGFIKRKFEERGGGPEARAEARKEKKKEEKEARKLREKREHELALTRIRYADEEEKEPRKIISPMTPMLSPFTVPMGMYGLPGVRPAVEEEYVEEPAKKRKKRRSNSRRGTTSVSQLGGLVS